jgi:hypothetical protein
LKVSLLVAQYFYQHRELNLPGIGRFYLDDAVSIPDVNDKNFRDFLQYIQYTQKNITQPDAALIDFIRLHTGKIKPLAESDLDSYVSDGKILLNIGKFFHVEGIGSLYKNKNGVYEFTPGEPSLQRLEVTNDKKETEKASKKKSVFEKDYYPHESKGNASRRLLIGVGVIVGLAIIVWGGYSLYSEKVQPTAAAITDTLEQPVDTAAQRRTDSLALAKAAADSLLAANAIAPGKYKFVFETTGNVKRAIKRHKVVSELVPDIKLESLNDSTLFKIFVVLPATAADTTRIKDSLNTWYYGSRPIKITIER